MKTATETDLVRSCLDYLKLRGIVAWRNNTGSFAGEYKGRKRFVRFSVPGASDIFALLPPRGRFLACECKMPKGKLSDAQTAFLDNITASGGLAVVVRSLDDLIDALEANHANPTRES